MAKTTELEAAYKATTYRVYLPGGVCDLRIGVACPALKDWLAASATRSFALITAYNPGSKTVDAGRNAEQQAALECDLLDGNYEPFVCQHVPDMDGAPEEEGCFVPDLDPEDANALAWDYGQNAVVIGGVDGVPHLHWVTDPDQDD